MINGKIEHIIKLGGYIMDIIKRLYEINKKNREMASPFGTGMEGVFFFNYILQKVVESYNEEKGRTIGDYSDDSN